MHHQLDTIAVARAFQEPGAEPDVHGPSAISVRHPLNDEPPRVLERVEQPADTLQVARLERAALAVHHHAFACRCRANRWTPHVHFFAGVREGFGHAPCVIRDAARHRWVLRRNEMHCHAAAVSTRGRLSCAATKMIAIGASGTSRRTNDVRTWPSISLQLLKR